MSLTGVLLVYERQITAWADREARTIAVPASGARVDAARLVAAARALRADVEPSSLILWADPAAAAAVSFGREGVVYVDRYTGEVSGEGSRSVRSFFSLVTGWHRWLGAGEPGRALGRSVTGACNLAFLVLVLTGPFLWLPRIWSWRHVAPVLLFQRRLEGRARDFNWHNVVGIWSAAPLFVIVACGVVISYPWAGDLLYRWSGESRRPARPERRRRGRAPILERCAARPARRDRRAAGAGRASGEGLEEHHAEASAARRPPVTFTIDSGNGGQPRLALRADPRARDRERRSLRALRRSQPGSPAAELGPLAPHGGGGRRGRADASRSRRRRRDAARLDGPGARLAPQPCMDRAPDGACAPRTALSGGIMKNRGLAMAAFAAYLTFIGSSRALAAVTGRLDEGHDPLSPRQEQQPVRRFDIAPGSLREALARFGEITALGVAASESIRSLPSPGVTGDFTPEQALEQLLARYRSRLPLRGPGRGRLELRRREAWTSPPRSSADLAQVHGAAARLPQTIVVSRAPSSASRTRPRCATCCATSRASASRPARAECRRATTCRSAASARAPTSSSTACATSAATRATLQPRAGRGGQGPLVVVRRPRLHGRRDQPGQQVAEDGRAHAASRSASARPTTSAARST